MVNGNILLGREIALNANDDIMFTSNNDVRLNTYSDNIKQAIFNRLRTPKGQYAKYPYYGSELYKLISMPQNDASLIYAYNIVYECLVQETRIKSIDGITCNYVKLGQNYLLKIQINVKLIDDPNKYNFIFDYNLN